jgi:hypothetical protein
MRILSIFLFVILCSCSEAPTSNAVGNAAESSSIIITEPGQYAVSVNNNLDKSTLPMNADLKMLDGDIIQYGLKLCGLDFANKLSPDRCEVFIQPDKAGLLVGYVALQQGIDVRISTDIKTDMAKSGLGCFLNGVLENSDYNKAGSKPDISQNFQARLPFFGEKKSSGDWMISSEESQGSAGGMWYVKRVGNNLRISQERWSYCYSDNRLYVDEVFRHALTFNRIIKPDSVTYKAATSEIHEKEQFESKISEWDCSALYGEEIILTLSDETYSFAPRNPEGGKKTGRLVKKPKEKNAQSGGFDIYLTLEDSGTEPDQWSIYERDKGTALLYFSELSGDGSECVRLGQQPKYNLN